MCCTIYITEVLVADLNKMYGPTFADVGISYRASKVHLTLLVPSSIVIKSQYRSSVNVIASW